MLLPVARLTQLQPSHQQEIQNFAADLTSAAASLRDTVIGHQHRATSRGHCSGFTRLPSVKVYRPNQSSTSFAAKDRKSRSPTLFIRRALSDSRARWALTSTTIYPSTHFAPLAR